MVLLTVLQTILITLSLGLNSQKGRISLGEPRIITARQKKAVQGVSLSWMMTSLTLSISQNYVLTAPEYRVYSIQIPRSLITTILSLTTVPLYTLFRKYPTPNPTMVQNTLITSQTSDQDPPHQFFTFTAVIPRMYTIKKFMIITTTRHLYTETKLNLISTYVGVSTGFSLFPFSRFSPSAPIYLVSIVKCPDFPG